jgi:thiol-disulfide isomerase/thioredoxin
MKIMNDVDKVKEVIETNDFVLGYFTSTGCNVCKDLLPKVEEMLGNFPQVEGIKSEADIDKRIVGEYSIFTVPTIVLFIEGKEAFRYARNVSIQELSDKIKRYYEIFYK